MILSLTNAFGWFGYRAKLSGGQYPGQGSRGSDGQGSSAGQVVIPQTALQIATYWACVKIIAQTFGTLPCQLFNVNKDGSHAIARDNPLFNILCYLPNNECTAVEFWEGVGAYLAVWGNAYARKMTIGGRLVGLELLRAEWMNVFRDTKDGSASYIYTDPLLGQEKYKLADLLHVKGFGFGDFVGLNALAFHRNAVGAAIAGDEAASGLFRNGLKAGGFLKYKGEKGVLNAEQRTEIRKALVEPHSGAENAGKTLVLPADLDWQAMTMNPVDAELMLNRRMSVEEICRCHGVPPVMIGHAAPGQTMWGTGTEAVIQSFLTTCLRPMLHRTEAAIGRDLLGRAQIGKVVAAFDEQELLRGDSKLRSEVERNQLTAGVVGINEVRAGYKLPPVVGGEAPTVNSAVIPLKDVGELAKLPKDKPVVAGGDVGIDPIPPGDPFEGSSKPVNGKAALRCVV